MHESAMDNCKKFIGKYLKDWCPDPKSTGLLKVLDLGSMDVNGSLKKLFPSSLWDYCGMDIAKGKNVNVVLESAYKFPFPDDHADVLVTSSCFEHNEFFWESFKEMVRVVKSGGFIYVCAPYKDGIHRCPVDCWRFLPDGYKALSKWCPQAQLLETYIDNRPHKDCVGIFKVNK